LARSDYFFGKVHNGFELSRAYQRRKMSADEIGLRARKTWRTVEPLHSMIYFVPEAARAYEQLGITGTAGYFASRSAPMGAVSGEVVVSTFFNFNPELVRSAIPDAWKITTPRALVAARLEGVDRSMRRVLGEDVLASAEMTRAAELARVAAEEACSRVQGRPLAAGHADLDWPDTPHLTLWHAQSILREYRGDGHIALLVTNGLSGIDALVTHAATGEVPTNVLQSTRGWKPEQWDASVEDLRSRGWLADGPDLKLTEWGSGQRKEIEDQTDLLSADPYSALGDKACEELRSIARPWSKVFAEVLFR
jgi:hypothetical protein